MPEAIPSCTLNPGEAGTQTERWRELARAAADIGYSERELTLAFGDDVPLATLERTIAVERECCPFFAISWDPASGRLRVEVDDPTHAPALDAVAERLGASR